MNVLRRDLGLLFAAMQASGQDQLPSRMLRYADLPVKTNAANPNKSRAVLDGKTHTGFRVEMHETELGPGLAPHPPHKHLHEELIIISEGTVEVTILNKTERLGPGSVAYVASNEEHGWRNVGDTKARYMILTLRG